MNTQTFQSLVKRPIKEQELLAPYTNFRIGGPAKWMVEVESVGELQAVLAIAKQETIPFVILGGGSNMLVSDHGFDGIVIRMLLREYNIEGSRIWAQAGLPTVAVARAAGDAGLTGFEWAVTLPGTIGGAVRGNAGCFDREIKDVLVSATLLRDGEIVEAGEEDLAFGYRDSVLKHRKDILLDVTFELAPGDHEKILEKMQMCLQKRRESQPTSGGSAGCLFKNYQIEHEEELARLQKVLELPPAMIEKRLISTGWLIDQMGLKGLRIGDAQISEQHGNFLLNRGKATTEEVMQLISFIKTKAQEKYGIVLEEEVQLIGFGD